MFKVVQRRLMKKMKIQKLDMKLKRKFCAMKWNHEGRFFNRSKTLIDIRENLFPSFVRLSNENFSVRQIIMMKKFDCFNEESISIILASNLHSDSKVKVKKGIAKLVFNYLLPRLKKVERLKTFIYLERNKQAFKIELNEDQQTIFYFKFFQVLGTNADNQNFGFLATEAIELLLKVKGHNLLPRISKKILDNFHHFSNTISIVNFTKIMFFMTRTEDVGDLGLEVIKKSLKEVEELYLFLHFDGIYELFETQRNLLRCLLSEKSNERKEIILDLIHRIEVLKGKALKKYKHVFAGNMPYNSIKMYYLFECQTEIENCENLNFGNKLKISQLNEIFDILKGGVGVEMNDQNSSLAFLNDHNVNNSLIEKDLEEKIKSNIKSSFSNNFNCVNNLDDFFLISQTFEKDEYPKLVMSVENLKLLNFLIELNLEGTVIRTNYGNKKVKLVSLRNVVEDVIEKRNEKNLSLGEIINLI